MGEIMGKSEAEQGAEAPEAAGSMETGAAERMHDRREVSDQIWMVTAERGWREERKWQQNSEICGQAGKPLSFLKRDRKTVEKKNRNSGSDNYKKVYSSELKLKGKSLNFINKCNIIVIVWQIREFPAQITGSTRPEGKNPDEQLYITDRKL